MNFTLQDLIGSTIAFLIFPSVMIFPGYSVGWVFDLFDFKQHRFLTRHIISAVISIALIPIVAYLFSLLFSFGVVKIVLAIFIAAYLIIIVKEFKKVNMGRSLCLAPPHRYQKLAFWVLVVWIIFSFLSLVDLHFGDRLYYSVVSYDFATRIDMVDAITRTGVPPVNPGYYPGHPEYITSVYYFWYILCSIVDQLGGRFVDARLALIAGNAWCGLALMALIGLYLRIRNNVAGSSAWKMVMVGIGLLSVSGMDVVPGLLNMIITRYTLGFTLPPGDIEHWNTQITAWVGSLFWVPHHMASMIACLAGLLFFQNAIQKEHYRALPVLVFAGLAFASASGLSTWVAITFSLFWGVWMLVMYLQKKDRKVIRLMLMIGALALVFASPYLYGVIKGGTGANGSPIAFEVRRFYQISPFLNQFSGISENIISLLLLPVNYLLELGFYFVVGVLWIQQKRKSGLSESPFYVPEMLLLCVVVIVCSFVRSSILESNDLGWRGWLFGQFVLLIWALDIYENHPVYSGYLGFIHSKLNPGKMMINKALMFLLIIGFSTTAVDVALLRYWSVFVDKGIIGFPNGFSPDTNLGQRTYSARLAYEFINDALPGYVVVQYNPLIGIDRASGLYGNRQNAISSNTAYNVSPAALDANTQIISSIFLLEQVDTWETIDIHCRENFINVLIVNDLDPLWDSLPSLYQQRMALYENRHFAVLACGDFASMR